MNSRSSRAGKFLGLLGALLMTSLSSAVPPHLVKDLNTRSSLLISDAAEFCQVGDTVFFSARTPTAGTELWKTDGTDAGTLLVKDIKPGLAPSNPTKLAALGGTVFFWADDGMNGRVLWKSDGTAEGTVIVKKLAAASDIYGIPPLTEAGGALFFSANDGVGIALWKTDGTEAGTVLLKRGSFSEFCSMNGILYCQGNDPATGRELWKSDGTTEGTTLLKDLRAGSASSVPRFLKVAGGALYFEALLNNTQGLWKSDGTAAGTVFVRNNWHTPFAEIGGFLYFRYDQDIWKSDGTVPGTVLVMTMPRKRVGQSSELCVVGDTLFFNGKNQAGDDALWKNDGTPGGTALVKVITSEQLTALGDLLIFSGFVTPGTSHLWKSDGTEAGTVLLREQLPQPNNGWASGNPSNLRAFGNTLYFNADDFISGKKLWRTDGTDEGTVPAKNITGTLNSEIHEIAASDGRAFFTLFETFSPGSSSQDPGSDLWQSDGTAEGTLLHDIVPGPNLYAITQLTDVNGTLFFAARDATYTSAWLWKIDATLESPVIVEGPEAPIARFPESLCNVDGTLFFSAYDSATGRELWKSDGTAPGTLLAAELTSGPDYISHFLLTPVGSTLFFYSNSPVHGYELWTSDGTAAGSVMVKDLFTGAEEGYLTPLVAMGGSVYFTANDGIHGLELWKSDGTPAGTMMVKDITHSHIDDIFDELTAVDGLLYFRHFDRMAARWSLWRSDGTDAGTVLLMPLGNIDDGGKNYRMTPCGNTLYFTANDAAAGMELWKSDGTPAGTVRVKDIRSGPIGSSLTSPTVLGGRLYFCANDGIHGEELWRSDGTEAGTTLVADITGDSGGSLPLGLCAVGQRLFFFASTDATGTELHVYDPTLPDPPSLAISAPIQPAPHGITLTGSVIPGGRTTTALIEYGTTTDYGSSISIPLSPADGMDPQGFSIPLTGLLPGTLYHYRYTAANSIGSRATADATFTTPDLPDITVEAPTGTAVGNGSILVTFPQTVIGTTFDYTITLRNGISSAVLSDISVTSTGPDAASFIVHTAPATSLAGGASTTCTLRFAPTRAGAMTATLSIASDDPDESPFTLGLAGSAITPFTAWQNQHTLATGPTGNSDGDALDNLQEFAFGTPPRSAQSSVAGEHDGTLLSRGAPTVRTGTALRGLFARRKDRAASGLVYTPQFSQDLSDWVDDTTPPLVLADDGEIEIVSVEFPVLSSGRPAKFFRVRVAIP